MREGVFLIRRALSVKLSSFMLLQGNFPDPHRCRPHLQVQSVGAGSYPSLLPTGFTVTDLSIPLPIGRLRDGALAEPLWGKANQRRRTPEDGE